MKRLLSLLVLLLPVMAVACLNDENDAAHAHVQQPISSFPVPKGHPMARDGEFRKRLESFREGYEKKEIEGSINYSVYLVYDKQYKLAEEVCRENARRWPNNYKVAANLGTVLELNDKNEEALKWIKKALEIDEFAHDGSEWIHVKILEAKLKPKEAFSGSKVTGIDFGQDSLPKSNAKENRLKKLQKELFFQLHERVTFVQPKDKYVAELMLELGNVTLALENAHKAKQIYDLAVKYGAKGGLIEKRLDKARAMANYRDGDSSGMDSTDAASDSLSTDSTGAEVGDGDESLYGPAEASPPSTVALVFMGLGLALVIGLFWRIFEGKAK